MSLTRAGPAAELRVAKLGSESRAGGLRGVRRPQWQLEVRAWSPSSGRPACPARQPGFPPMGTIHGLEQSVEQAERASEAARRADRASFGPFTTRGEAGQNVQ
jgi:hypothetical protein